LEEETPQAAVNLLNKTSGVSGALGLSISPSANGIIGKQDTGALTTMASVEPLAL